MPVSDTHPEYNKYLPQWQTVRDCVEGSAAVKKAGTKYLPKPNAEDTSSENAKRYEAYLQRANFVNFTGHTKKGMTGMVFRRDTEVELPTNIEYLTENANGGGLTLDQMIKAALGDILETGRYGLLVDYPEMEEGATQAQTANLQANILSYPAESVINWRTTVIDGVKKLSLVVLREPKEIVAEDGFSTEEKIYHRVLALEEGFYIQYLYNEDGEQVAMFIPRQSNGSAWDTIPFVFVGSENNDETVDEAPLYDLAEVNLAHYRNSADYEESAFMVGQPTPVFSGLTQAWVDTNMKKSVMLGSRAAIPLPEGGSADLLQANPNQMPSEGMKAKEDQMVKIGARIIQDNTGQETAEAAKIRFAGQNSELGSIVGNIESALLQCFEWAGFFMGEQGEATLEVNKQFYDKSLDAQQIMAMIQLADRGDISQPDIRSLLRKAGLIDEAKTDDDIDTELGELGLSLGVTDQNLQGEAQGNNEMMTLMAAILEKLSESRQEFIPAGQGGGSGATTVTESPTFTIEAPITLNLPEGFITFPENMVSVVVNPPEVTVEGAQSPVIVQNGQMNKDGTFTTNEAGAITGFQLRVVSNEQGD